MSASLMLTAHPPGVGSGSSRRGAVALEALRSRYERVDVLSLAGPGERALADPAAKLIHRPAPPSPAGVLASLARGGSFWHPERAGHLADAVCERTADGRLLAQYDLVWAYSALMAGAAGAVGGRVRILDIDNVAGNQLREWAHESPPLAPRGLLRRLDARAVAREERRRANRFDQVVVTSEREAENLGPVRPPVTVVPNTVAGPPQACDPAAAPRALLLVGSLDYEPNVAAVATLAREILPGVRTRVPGAQATVVGRNPTPEVVDTCRSAGIELAADVPSLDPYYASARAVVAPMRLGGDAPRVKVIEAMAYGAAIVATPQAAVGTGLSHGQSALLADDPVDLAELCLRLLEAPEDAARLGRAARELWHERLRPEVARAAIGRILDTLAVD